MSNSAHPFGALLWVMMGTSLLNSGCLSSLTDHTQIKPAEVPKELKKVSMPEYVVEPPDILLIDAVRLVPKGPYRIQPLDALLIRATDVLPTDPIANVYGIEPDGKINLGFAYGQVRGDGMTLEDAQKAILEQVKKRAKATFASASPTS